MAPVGLGKNTQLAGFDEFLQLLFHVGKDGTAIARLDEQWKTTRMVDVGMAQHQGVDRCRIEGKGLAVAGLVLAATLDQPTVEQDPLLTNLDQMAGTGDLTGRTETSNLECHSRSPFIQALSVAVYGTAATGRILARRCALMPGWLLAVRPGDKARFPRAQTKHNSLA